MLRCELFWAFSADDASNRLAEELRDGVAERRRLHEQAKADRRVREQHSKMLTSMKQLRAQVDAELSSRKALQADLEMLQAKVCFCCMETFERADRPALRKRRQHEAARMLSTV